MSQHNHKSFFKYVTADTAAIILKNQTLRWSSPILFNDPFDVPREFLPDVSKEQLASAIAKSMFLLLKNNDLKIDEVSEALRPLFEEIKNKYPNGAPERIINSFERMIENTPVSKNADLIIDDFREHWRKLVKNLRILCLTTDYKNTPMWNHYAESYTGVVLEFLCKEETQSPWMLAKPVCYTDEKPKNYSPEGMAELLVLPQKKGIEYLVDKSTYIKKTEWSQEKEWRVLFSKRPNELNKLTSDYTFHHKEPSGEIKILSKKYPNAKIVKVLIGPSGDFIFE